VTADGAVPARRKPAVTVAPTARRADAADSRRLGSPAKPAAAGLGVDLAALDWQRSGTGTGSFEVAFIAARRDDEDGRFAKPPGHGEEMMKAQDGTAEPAVDWVLLRVAGDPAARVLVYDRTEWLCFIDGVARGEFELPA
jgi:hypothetical protein